MMKNPLMKRLMGERLEGGRKDVLHSTVYGKAQNRDRIGVASTETFKQRQAVERNRSTVRRYRDSLVAGQRAEREKMGETENRAETGLSNGKTDEAMGLNRGGTGGTANLTEMAKVRAERSARFAPKNGGTGAGKVPPRRFPGVK